MTAGFKEWKSVCDALEHGEQTIILRKGGIAEGSEGFLWQHREFFLFPTMHHNHRDQLKKGVEANDTSFTRRTDGKIEIRLHAKVIWSADINSLKAAAKLSPFHIWAPETIEQRFDYTDNKGIRLALLRVFRLHTPWILDDSPTFSGCRSWIELPKPETGQLLTDPVIAEDNFSAQKKRLEQVLSAENISITEFDP